MRLIVADANVLVSAALARSPDAPSARILDLAIDGQLTLITCPHLLAEVRDVLDRPRLAKYLTPEEAARFVADLTAQTRVVPDPGLLARAISRDPDDDYLIAIARTHHADAIVTGDDDLLTLTPDQTGVLILTPRQLISRL